MSFERCDKRTKTITDVEDVEGFDRLSDADRRRIIALVAGWNCKRRARADAGRARPDARAAAVERWAQCDACDRWFVLAEDEAAIDKSMLKASAKDSDSEAEDDDSDSDSDDDTVAAAAKAEEAARRARKKAMAGVGMDKVMVYDQQGDSLDKLTRESYISKTYVLHYETERILPKKRD